jgi:serine/threonine protein kinase
MDSRAFIEYHEIQFKDHLGSGAFGNVFSGTCRGLPVAIKVLKQKQLPEQQMISFRKEVTIMSKIAHPNVLTFLGVCLEADNLLLITELLQMDLLTVLHNPKIDLSPFDKVKIARDIALGCNWIHSLGILHRDLKSSNILVAIHHGDMTIRICDFGLSQLRPSGDSMAIDPDGKPRGTINWMAPEVLRGKSFDEKSDIWGFGIVLWELFTRQLPYQNWTREEVIQYVTIKKEKLPIPFVVEDSIQKLYLSCLEWNSADRPSFANILDQIQCCLVDTAISDPLGRVLWNDFFIQEKSFLEFVSWAQFWGALTEFIPSAHVADDFGRKCLKLMLVKEDVRLKEEQVSAVDFGQLLLYFPLKPSSGSKNSLLSSLVQFCEIGSFFGQISQVDSDRLLKKNSIGAYLVRFSSTPGTFTISYVDENQKIKNKRLQYNSKTGTLIMDKLKFSSLKDLIQTQTLLPLKHACPGSKFVMATQQDEDESSYVPSL